MTDLVTGDDALDLTDVLDFINSPATRHEVEAAIHRARQRRLDDHMDAELAAARLNPSQAIDAWIQEKDRSGDAARRNYPREVTRWAAFLAGGPAAVDAISPGRSSGAELDDSRRFLLAADRSDVARYREFLKEKRKTNGVRTVLSTLGSFYSYLERSGYIATSPFAGISRPRRESRVHVRAAAGQVPIMSDDEIHQVLETASALSDRVGTALDVMAVFGIRVGSVVSLEAGSDYIAFRAKGGKLQRILFRDLKAAPRDPQAVAALPKGKPFAG